VARHAKADAAGEENGGRSNVEGQTMNVRRIVDAVWTVLGVLALAAVVLVAYMLAGGDPPQWLFGLGRRN
jgi:hypothetical protein